MSEMAGLVCDRADPLAQENQALKARIEELEDKIYKFKVVEECARSFLTRINGAFPAHLSSGFLPREAQHLEQALDGINLHN
ncbi:MAG: hypothetical protein HYU64_09430 [Armatimonadetes bacterium]|nr:hypothetical protein [Armatimonadota bacterium]